MSKLLILTLVHDFAGKGWHDAYLCDDSDPNLIIRNNLDNIFKFNSNVEVVIHVNKSFDEFDDSIGTLDHVHVNPKRYHVLHPIVNGSKVAHSALTSYLTSYKHALDLGLEFDYVTIVHSSEMFVKPNCLAYMQQSEYSGWHPPRQEKDLFRTAVYPVFMNTLKTQNRDLFCGLFDPLDPLNYGVGQVEGSFYTKELFTRIYNWFDSHYDIETLNQWNIYAEEIMIPTLAYYLSDSKSPSAPINAFFVDKGHVPLDSMEHIHEIRNNKPVFCWGPIQYGTYRAVDSTHLYTVKRVNRTLTDPVRQGISNLSVYL